MMFSDYQLLLDPKFEKTMGYRWVILSKLGCFKSFELNIPSCRVFYGLSENHKIIRFGQTVFKLWPLKDKPFSIDL